MTLWYCCNDHIKTAHMLLLAKPSALDVCCFLLYWIPLFSLCCIEMYTMVITFTLCEYTVPNKMTHCISISLLKTLSCASQVVDNFHGTNSQKHFRLKKHATLLLKGKAKFTHYGTTFSAR